MRNDIRLSDVLGTNQIFTKIMTDHEVPWADDENITGALLDYEYNYNFSGDKLISPAVHKHLGDDGKIKTVGKDVTVAEVFESASPKRDLPIYCVDRGDEKICAISFDAAWGNSKKVQNNIW